MTGGDVGSEAAAAVLAYGPRVQIVHPAGTAVWVEYLVRVSGRYRQRVSAEKAQPERALTAVFGGDLEFSHTVILRIKKDRPALFAGGGGLFG